MRPTAREAIPARLEQVEALDVVAEPLQRGVRAAVPYESQLKDVLSGTWLGHPLHPPLTDVVVGAWTSALVLDLLGGADAETAADRLVGVGVVAAVPTAAAGLSDWAELRGGRRRVGMVHALGNSTALVLNALSWTARMRGDRRRGVALSAAGYAVASFSAWLGGHLSFGQGVGVNQAAFEEVPDSWTVVLDEAQLPEGELVGARVDGTAVLLVRRGADVHALADRCSHRGCALHEGTLRGDTITCPCHGSTFRLDGTVVKGPATSPQPRYDARVESGRVEVRRPANGG
ncbi:MAG TPA: Rieske 2Fe-2S domain-containing protein [Gaiellaceae bacterium]